MKHIHLNLCHILVFCGAMGLWGVGHSGYAQTHRDSLILKRGSYLIYNGKTIYANRDTVIWIDSDKTIKVRHRKPLGQRRWVKQAWDWVYVGDRDTTAMPTRPSQAHLEQFSGKYIRQIRFVRLKPFGTSVLDTTLNNAQWLGKIANRLHPNTSERILRNNLLFRQGDRLNTYTLADNERVWRSLPFIRDARVLVSPDSLHPDEADVWVITQDKWTIEPSGGIDGTQGGNVRLTEQNLLGWGQQLDQNLLLNTQTNQLVGFETTYTLKSIAGSFIDLQARASNTFNRSGYGLNIARLLLAPQLRWAGGVQVQRQWEVQGIYNADSLRFVGYGVGWQGARLWAAWAMRLGAHPRLQRARWVLSSSYEQKNYWQRPEAYSDYLFDYQRYLFSIACNHRQYYRGNLIYAFGQTEDIPVGILSELTVGNSHENGLPYTYTGARLAWAKVSSSGTYQYLSMEAGAYWSGSGTRQSIYRADGAFFSRLRHWRNVSLRHFLYLNWVEGNRLFAPQVLTLDSDNGIRTLSSNQVIGTRRLTCTWETVAFLPTWFYGFRVALYGAIDTGRLWGANANLNGENFGGISLGARLRNDKLTFNVIQLRLAYYVVVPTGINPLRGEVGSIAGYRFNDFTSRPPQVIDWR